MSSQRLDEQAQQAPPALSWADEWEAANGKPAPLALLMDMLKQPISGRDVKSKQGADYMDITTIRDRVDERIGPHRWDWSVTQAQSLGGAPFYSIIGQMTIRGADGEVTKAGCGAEGLWEHQPFQNKKGTWVTKAYGDPVTNAEASALRRACMAFGFARELWRK